MIQWHEFGGSMQSHCGRFEIEEVLGGWRAEDVGKSSMLSRSPLLESVEAAKGWCEMRVQTEQVVPDVLIETIDGHTVILPATEAPEF